jgi:hypothetical protein
MIASVMPRSSCSIPRYAPTLVTPVSGSLVITEQPVAMYRPPSCSCHSGTGNRVRSTAAPSTTFSFTGPSGTTCGGKRAAFVSQYSGRPRSASTSSRSVMSVEKRRQVPNRRELPDAPVSTRYPAGYPLMWSNSSAGNGLRR